MTMGDARWQAIRERYARQEAGGLRRYPEQVNGHIGVLDIAPEPTAELWARKLAYFDAYLTYAPVFDRWQRAPTPANLAAERAVATEVRQTWDDYWALKRAKTTIVTARCPFCTMQGGSHDTRCPTRRRASSLTRRD
jgi:hypothetical protein